MSDTRDEAEQELVAAGMASGMEDALASSLSTSFSMPPQPHKPHHAIDEHASAKPDLETAPPTETIEGMDEWKTTYEGYLEQWHAEGDVAREKAQATRNRIEEQKEAERRLTMEKSTAQRQAQAAWEKEQQRKERLRRELEEKIDHKVRNDVQPDVTEREGKVKEAWQMVKGSSSGREAPDKEVVSDGRGVTDQDLLAGQANLTGREGRPPVKQTMYDPTTSTEPLPPSMQDSKASSSRFKPSRSASSSQHATTPGAWEDVSGSPSSAEDLSPPGTGSSFSNAEMTNVQPADERPDEAVINSAPHDVSTASAGRINTDSPGSVPQRDQPQNQSRSGQTPPAQPPSLTLSLFTTPSHLSFSRVVAILGINLFLPFVNGVMLGFGEIFAREVVKVGKIWWSKGGSEFQLREPETRHMRYADHSFAGGRGVSGVGLSGSGGFP